MTCRKKSYLAEFICIFYFSPRNKDVVSQVRICIVLIMSLRALVVLIFSYAIDAKGL